MAKKSRKEYLAELEKYKDIRGNDLKEDFYTDGIYLYHIEPAKNKPKYLTKSEKDILIMPGNMNLEWIAFNGNYDFLPVYPPRGGIMSNPHVLSSRLKPINPNKYLKSKKYAKARINQQNRYLRRFVEDCLKK